MSIPKLIFFNYINSQSFLIQILILRWHHSLNLLPLFFLLTAEIYLPAYYKVSVTTCFLYIDLIVFRKISHFWPVWISIFRKWQLYALWACGINILQDFGLRMVVAPQSSCNDGVCHFYFIFLLTKTVVTLTFLLCFYFK